MTKIEKISRKVRMEPASPEFVRLLKERIAHHEAYLSDMLPQAEAYQREVKWMQDRIATLKECLKFDDPSPPKEKS